MFNREEYLQALELVSQDYKNLEGVKEEFKDNEDIVYEAIYQDGYALKWASERLRDNKDLVITAISSKFLEKSEINSTVLQFASERLRDDEEVVIESLKYNWGSGFKYASERLRSDEQMALIAITMSPICFEYLSDELKNDKKFILQAINMNSFIYQYLPNSYKTDKEILLQGFKSSNRSLNNTDVFLFNLSTEVKQFIIEDRDLLKEIIAIDGKALPSLLGFAFHDNNTYITDRELALIAIKTYPDIYIYLDNTLKADPEIHKYIE